MKTLTRRSALSLSGAALLGLAACSASPGRDERVAERYAPQGQFFRVGGQRIHVVARGRGPDLVLIHGASGNARDFTFSFTGAVGDRYRTFAVDRPGLGWSDHADGDASPVSQARALRAAIRQLGVRRPILLGQSYGAAVAMAWALEAPGDVAGLVLVSGTTLPWPDELTASSTALSTARTRAALARVIASFANETNAAALLPVLFAPQRPPAGYGDFVGIGLAIRATSIRNNALQIAALRPALEKMAPLYPALPMPIEIVHGDADRIVAARLHSIPLAEQLPQANLTLIPDAGHMPHHTHRNQVIAAIDRAARRAGLR